MGSKQADGDMARRPFAVAAFPAGQNLTLRVQTAEDVVFLRRLYVSLRWDEVQRVPHWDDATRLAFLEDQHRLQHHHYSTHYARSDFLIIERDGEPVGRLALDRGHAHDLRVVDIALLAKTRGSGIGTALLVAVQDEARSQGKTVSIHVEGENPARRLYARLGFREVEQEGPYWLMSWTAEIAQD